MNPWTIIGWIVLAIIAVPVISKIMQTSMEWGVRRIAYIKTRNTPPAEGQRWDQDGSILEIGRRWPNGHFAVISKHGGSSASWGETDKEWRERVRNRKLFLVSAPSVPKPVQSPLTPLGKPK